MPPEAIVSSGVFRAYYPHSVGHWIGMDTHDVPSISGHTPLKDGVVLTIEPGLYLPPKAHLGRYAGIGVRIEDDVLVTSDGFEVLSGDLPIEAEEVEALVCELRSCN